ncbi:acetolactate synthase small subunit [bacterium]|nr:MAG: acetolactate synthase small subunit [bacterium]
MSATQHTVTALVQNEAGTINRVVSLFRRRGFSLASFNAGDCEQPGFSRMTFVVDGDRATVGQVLKQLDRLIDVVECEDLPDETSVARELALIKVSPTPDQRKALYAMVLEYFAKTPSATEGFVVVEFAGEVREVEQLIERLEPYNIVEIVRTGLVAIGL